MCLETSEPTNMFFFLLCSKSNIWQTATDQILTWENGEACQTFNRSNSDKASVCTQIPSALRRRGESHDRKNVWIEREKKQEWDA